MKAACQGNLSACHRFVSPALDTHNSRKSRPPRTSWTAARTIAPQQSWRIRKIKTYWLLCCSCGRYGEWANTFQKKRSTACPEWCWPHENGRCHATVSRKYGWALSGYGDTKVSESSTTVEVLQHQHQQPTDVQNSQNGLSSTRLGGTYVP